MHTGELKLRTLGRIRYSGIVKVLKILVLAINYEWCFHNACIWEGFSSPQALYTDNF